MSNQVRVGVIGTSGWTDMFLLPTLTSHQQAEVAAICGRNQTRAGDIAAQHKIPLVYADYRQMVEEAALDALVVAAPDDLHHAMVMAGLDAGLHILCEKPLANNGEHARQMLDKAEATNRKHMVVYTWRWLPQLQYIKHLLDDGYLGRVYQARFRFSFNMLHSRDYAWRIDADRANGVLGDFGSHMIDLARWLLGAVDTVSASLKTQIERDGVENPANDSAFLMLEFRNGAHGSIECSYVTHQADHSGFELTLHGEHGSLQTQFYPGQVDYVVCGALRDENAWQPLAIPPEFMGDFNIEDKFAGYQSGAIGPRLFIDGIVNNTPIEPDFNDGYLNQLVIDAAFESQRNGCRIKLTEYAPQPATGD